MRLYLVAAAWAVLIALPLVTRIPASEGEQPMAAAAAGPHPLIEQYCLTCHDVVESRGAQPSTVYGSLPPFLSRL